MQDYRNGDDQFAGLTDKQRQVLDLLIQHKTSKEIARELDISPHTVDQRIQFAKEKLGAATRSEAAVAYRELLEAYEREIYENSGIASDAATGDDASEAKGPFRKLLDRLWTQSGAPMGAEADYRVTLELFEGRYGTWHRLGVIFAIAVLLVLLVLGGLAMLNELSVLLARR